MVKKEGNIWAIDENGTVVKEYKSMQEVSDITGVNLSTLFYRFYHLVPSDGLLYILKTSYEKVLQNNLHEIFYSHRNLNKIRMEKSVKKKVNHTIKYEVRHKLVCITPCPFSESEDRPKVGSARCVNCSSFVEKNTEAKEVYCGFNQFGFKNICKRQQQ